MLEFLKSGFSIVSSFAVYKLLPAALIFVAGIFVVQIVTRLLEKAFAKSKFDAAAVSLILSVIRVALYIVLALMTASSLGIDVTGVVALASVLTLAVSLSVQDALSNLIGGFTLLYTKPFSSGDFVEIAGQSGSVQEIGLTYTKLSTPDNKYVYIPNGAVTSAEIVNYTVLGTRRLDIAVSASYNSPVQAVLSALKEAGNLPGILEEQGIFVALDSYGESAINYVLRVWTTGDDYWTVKFAINEKIKEVFDARGIEMTYPHLNVHLDGK